MNYKQVFLCQPTIFALLIFFFCNSCEKQPVNSSEAPEKPESALPNILLVIADDIGKDAFPNYPEGQDKPQLPTFNNLMANGVTFDNLWTYL